MMCIQVGRGLELCRAALFEDPSRGSESGEAFWRSICLCGFAAGIATPRVDGVMSGDRQDRRSGASARLR